MKKIVSLIISVMILLSISQPINAQRNNIEYYSIYKSIRVMGYADPTTGNPYVTLTLKNGEEIIGFGEAPVGADGRYEYIFKAPKMNDTAELKVKCAGEDVTSQVYEAIMETKSFVKVPYTLIDENDIYNVTADLSEVTKFTKNFTVFAAQYNENGILAGCESFDSDELENKGFFEKNIDKKGTLKLFVWTSAEQIASAGKFVEGDGGVLLQFGAKADNQQREGYKAISGENGYERYLQIKSELPEELDVVEEQKPDIKQAFYVSSSASGGDGSLENPFGTIQEALNAYSALNEYDRENWTAIYLMGGDYDISQTLLIDSSITGENREAELFIGAYNGEKVTFSNKKTVTGDMFTAVTEDNTDSETIERIHKNAGQIYYIDYDTVGIDLVRGSAYGTNGKKPKLLYNGKEQTLARYPNGGDTYIANIISDGYDEEYPDYAVFVPSDTRPFEWKNQKDVFMAGQLSVNWYYNHMQAYFDNELNHVKVLSAQAAAQNNGIGERLSNRPEDRAHFHYYNVFEEMDMQGEWCYSDEEKRIYIYPDADIESAEISFRANMTDYALKINGISDIIIDGIGFEMLKDAVRIEGCESIVIQNCEFKNNESCIRIYESESAGVLSSDFRNVYTGVSISGASGNIGDLKPERNFVQDCYFNGVENDCISMSYSSGNVISHNLAENFRGWFGAVFYGCENIIEYNEVYAGGFNGNEDYIIYLDGHYDARGNQVRYNYFHDLSPDPSEIVCGLTICMDDLSEEQYVYGNVIENVYGGIYGNGGDNNVIDGNYIIDCNSKNKWCSIEMGDYMYGRRPDTIGNNFLDDVRTKRHMSSYYSLGMANSKWGQRYPHAVARATYLEGVSEVWQTGDKISEEMMFARLCTGNYITNNVGVNAGVFEINPDPVLDDMNNDGEGDTTYVNDMYIQTTNPADGVTQDGNGNDYNVMWNNSYCDSIDAFELPVVKKAGLIREQIYKDSTVIEFTYPSDNADFDAWEACWNKIDKANFFKLIVATDESFNNVVSEKWMLDNRSTLSIDDYDEEATVYYYKVQAYNAGMGEGSLTTPIAETEVRSIEVYQQKSDVTLISEGVANLAENWGGTLGTNQIRNSVKGMLSQQTDDGYYVRFTAPAASNEKTYRMVWGSPYENVEKSTNKYDSNTTMNVSLKFRFPSEGEFGDYADIAMSQWYPGKYAQDLDLGCHANEVKIVVRKEKGLFGMVYYNLYLNDYGRRNPTTHKEESDILLKRYYSASQLFGRWIDAEYSVDMATGITTGTVDGVAFETDQNDTNWGKSYEWNPESHLRFFDFALKTNTGNKFILDVKDVNIVRKINK